MVRFSSLVLIWMFGLTAQSQFIYDFNKNCREAYTAIIGLKFDEGSKLIESEKQRNPNNNIPYLLENYIYFLTVFIGEENDTFKEFDKKKNAIITRLNQGDKTSPYYQYSLAQVNLQWAVARTKFKEYVSATLEINKAYRLLKRNRTEFPDFLPNLINLGLLHTMIGTIPDNYNWAKRMVGIDGSIDQGVNEILTVLKEAMINEDYSHYKAECLFYLSFIQINLMTNKEKTMDFLKLIEEDNTSLKSPLAVYAMARIYMSNGQNDKAINILTERPTGQSYFPFYFLDYLTGLTKLHRLDDDAHTHLLRYVIHFKGSNFIKDSYQKIAWHYLVHGDEGKYQDYIARVSKFGNTVVDADKQAQKEAETGVRPQVNLLRARLLFDGGYYQKAIEELTVRLKPGSLHDEAETLEYVYRLGRIYHEWGKIDQGIIHYEKTIRQGSSSELYYAANSALQLGLIHEEKGDYEKARIYYTQAQNMKNTEYRNSINQKAKAGLNRIENR